jgi:hypothetical protein
MGEKLLIFSNRLKDTPKKKRVFAFTKGGGVVIKLLKEKIKEQVSSTYIPLTKRGL